MVLALRASAEIASNPEMSSYSQSQTERDMIEGVAVGVNSWTDVGTIDITDGKTEGSVEGRIDGLFVGSLVGALVL